MSVKFESRYNCFRSRIRIWKWCLQNGGHFVSVSMGMSWYLLLFFLRRPLLADFRSTMLWRRFCRSTSTSSRTRMGRRRPRKASGPGNPHGTESHSSESFWSFSVVKMITLSENWNRIVYLQKQSRLTQYYMKTSSHGNIVRITGPGDRWIPFTRRQKCGALMFLSRQIDV